MRIYAPPVTHHSASEIDRALQYVKGSFLHGTSLVEFTCKLLEFHSIVRKDEISYFHPEPPFSRVFMFRKSSTLYADDDCEFPMLPGKIYFIPAGRSFRTDYSIGDSQIALHLHITDFTGCGIVNKDDSIIEIDDPPLFEKFADSSLKSGSSALLSPCLELCLHVVNVKADEIAVRTDKMSSLSPLFDYINKSPVPVINISEMAEALGSEADLLSHRFRRINGKSLKSFLNSRVITQAQELLLHGRLSVAAISEKLGFSDDRYFQRFFREKCGISPGAFRRRNS